MLARIRFGRGGRGAALSDTAIVTDSGPAASRRPHPTARQYTNGSRKGNGVRLGIGSSVLVGASLRGYLGRSGSYITNSKKNLGFLYAR